MKLVQISKVLLVSMLTLAAGGLQAAIIYSVSDGTTTTIVNPLSTASSAATYYDYSFDGQASADPAFGTEEDKVSFGYMRTAAPAFSAWA